MKARILLLCFLSITLLVDTARSEQVTRIFTFSDFELSKDESNNYRIYATNGDYVYPEQEDLPNLPYCYVSVLLPPNKDINTFSFTHTDSIVDTNVYLYPAELPVPTSQSIVSPIVPRFVTYANSIYPTTIAELSSVQEFRGYRYANFCIYPFVYNTQAGTLTFVKNVTISYSLKAANTPTRIDQRRKTMLQSFMVNPNTMDSYYPISGTEDESDANDIDYLIITVDSLKSAFDPLRYWKIIKGIRTIVVTLEDIYNNSLYQDDSQQLQIKRCIYDYYINRNIKYVLLGGDDVIVPVMKCYGQAGDEVDNIPCDLFYACFNGQFDWNANGNDVIGELNDNVNLSPDVDISRLPIRTRADVEAYTNKLLHYEQSALTTNYANNFLMCADLLFNAQDGKSDAHIKSDILRDTIATYLPSSIRYRFYDTDTDFGGADYELNPTHITSQILDKQIHFLNYIAHGSVYGFSNETSTPFTSNSTLNNRNTPLIVITNACNTNRFDNLGFPCPSESFIRNPNGGAICYWGSSRYGWDSTWAYSLGASSKYVAQFYRFLGLFGQTSNLATNFASITTFAKAFLSTQSNSYSSLRWVQYSLNAVGDAEVPIYTQNPKTFTNVEVIRNGNTVTVSAELSSVDIPSLRITVTSQDSAVSYFSKAEAVQTHVFTNVPAAYNVVVTANNYLPYIYSDPIFIQNEVFVDSKTINGTNIVAGHHVTDTKQHGNVVIQDGSSVVLNSTDEVTLEDGFEVELGGSLEINN